MGAKVVAFDMDGVLVNTEGFYNRRRAAYLAEALPGYTGPWDFSGSNDTAIWETIVPDDPELRERLHAGYDAYRKTHPEPYAELANPYARSVLQRLRDAGLYTAIASSSAPHMVEQMMAELGISELVDYHVSGCEVAAHKPDPAIYLQVMRHFGVFPEELVVVEDSPVGIAAGVGSGAWVVALAQYVRVGIDQSAADARIMSLDELSGLLAR